jgi:hypothetical protein
MCNLRYLSPAYCIYVSKDARIRGYFSKPKGVREQKSLENTALVPDEFSLPVRSLISYV